MEDQKLTGMSCLSSPVNIGDPLEPSHVEALRRVLEIQTKLHCWAGQNDAVRFGDLFNLVCDTSFLLVAYDKVAGNKGAGTPGIDGATVAGIEQVPGGARRFLAGLRDQLKTGGFTPLPVRQRMIPKPGGKLRRLGIPVLADRVVQASLKLVLEPIFEADFLPCSYGFRPNRRCWDAVAEIIYFASRPRCYEWVVEGDIAACFDNIDHTGLLGRVRRRIKDKKVIGLVRAFLKAGIMTVDAGLVDTTAGTPQGGILSPLLANIALSVLDEFIDGQPGGPQTTKVDRAARLRHHQPNFRLVRYADDWCLMVRGTRDDAQQLLTQIAGALVTVGLTLSADKTLITHIDQGIDFLGWRIQRHLKKGTNHRCFVYSYPSRKSVTRVKEKIKTITGQVPVNQPLSVLLRRLNTAVTGWCYYFRVGVSSATFAYLNHVLWSTVWRWLRRKHKRSTITQLRRRYCGGGWWPSDGGLILVDPAAIRTRWYRHRGNTIPSPWPDQRHSTIDRGEPGALKGARQVRGAATGNPPHQGRAPVADSTDPRQQRRS